MYSGMSCSIAEALASMFSGLMCRYYKDITVFNFSSVILLASLTVYYFFNNENGGIIVLASIAA